MEGAHVGGDGAELPLQPLDPELRLFIDVAKSGSIIREVAVGMATNVPDEATVGVVRKIKELVLGENARPTIPIGAEAIGLDVPERTLKRRIKQTAACVYFGSRAYYQCVFAQLSKAIDEGWLEALTSVTFHQSDATTMPIRTDTCEP